jgi:uncharacterized protein with GYD domain
LDRRRNNVKATLERTERVDQLAEKHGARLKQTYWTIGPYDIVAILEASDEESAAAFALELGSMGNVRTTTLRAYNREAMSRIIEKLGPS